jgi:hypothetical protein
VPASIEEDSVAQLRLQPVVARSGGWRARSGSLVAVALVGFVIIGIALGTAVDDGSSRPPAVAVASFGPIATVRPTLTRVQLATPLPTVENLGGTIPTERRLVYANGLQVLDLATGTLTAPSTPFYDAMLPLANNQLVCACVLPAAPDEGRQAASLEFGRFDLTGAPIIKRHLLVFDDVVPVVDMNEGYGVATAMDADQQSLYVLVIARRPPVWSIDLYRVKVETGEIVATTVLDRQPVDLDPPAVSPTPRPDGGPTDGVYAWPNYLITSPDGQTVLASVQYSEIRGDLTTNSFREWMVPIRDGVPGTARRLATAASMKPDDWCLGPPAFMDPKLVVQACRPGGDHPSGTSYYIRRLTVAGTSLSNLPVEGLEINDQFPVVPLVDRERRVVLIWDPGQHSLVRVSVDDGFLMQVTVPAAMLPQPDPLDGGSGIGGSPALVLSPDHRRLYALGFRASPGPAGTSTGVWVFDARTMRLRDHWAPRALLISLAVSADGRFVYAAGAQGLDVEGRENAWPASVTVYDAAMGQVQALYGSVGRGTWISFPDWPNGGGT